MSIRETQTADCNARIKLPAEFADATVVVEVLNPREVVVRKVGDELAGDTGSDELMKLTESSGALDFWNEPAEDIYGPEDGEPA